MKNHVKIVLFILLLTCSVSLTLQAQESRRISVAAMNESIAFPFTSYTEFHPGIEFGMSVRSVEKERSIRTINSYVGWFLHQNIENSFYLRAEYLHEFNLISRIKAGVYGGVGYMHTFYPGYLYEMDPQTGDFSKSRQLGRPRALISTGIQLSYDLQKGLSPFLRQEFSVETPFANGIPFMPHSFIKIGVTKNF